MDVGLIILIGIQLMIWVYIMGLNTIRVLDHSNVENSELMKLVGGGILWFLILILPIILRVWMVSEGIV